MIKEQQDSITFLNLKLGKKGEDWKEFEQLAKRMHSLSSSLNF